MFDCEMIMSLEHLAVSYEMLTSGDMDQTIDTVCRVFANHEPLALRMGLEPEDMKPVAQGFCECALQEDSGVIVKDKASGTVVGFAIGHDFMSESPEPAIARSEKLAPILNLLEILYQKYGQSTAVHGDAFLINVGGVDHAFYQGSAPQRHLGGNQIAEKLFEASINVARKKGFKKCVGMATSYFSQNQLCNNFAFQEVFRLNYSDFYFGGKAVFKGMPWHHSCQLLEKIL